MTKMRSLGDILGDIRVQNVHWTRIELAGAVGFRVPRGKGLVVHFVLNGTPIMNVRSRANFSVQTGDVMIVLDQQAHVIGNSSDAEVHPFAAASNWLVEEVPIENQLSGGEPGIPFSSTVLTGFFRIRWPVELSQWGLLPPVLHGNRNFKSDAAGLEVMRKFGQLVSRPGGAHCVTRYAEFLLVRELQQVLQRSPGLLRASSSNDNKMEQALAALSQDPAFPWSVAALAQHVGMSRSTFAACFTKYAGGTPMAVVFQHRMELAAQYLKRKSLPIKEIAGLIGFGSVSSFTRAFSLHFGSPPAAYRNPCINNEVD